MRSQKQVLPIAQKYLDVGCTLREIAEKTSAETGQKINFSLIDKWLSKRWLKRKSLCKKFVEPKILKRAQELLDIGLSYTDIATQLSTVERPVTVDSINSWVKRGRVKRILPETKTHDGFMQLSGNFIVCSDAHLPYADMQLVRHMMTMARNFQVRKILIAGDLLDQEGLSIKFKESGGNLEAEIEAAANFLDLLSQWFTEIRLFVGNHDTRILRQLEFKLSVESYFKMISQDLKMNQYPYCRIKSGKGTWYITHPKNYSRISTRVAHAINHREKCHVGVAHGHAMGITYSPSGEDVLFDTGGLFDQKKIKYKNVMDTTHGNWISGFSIIRNGYLYQFTKEHTDWNFWLNMKMPK